MENQHGEARVGSTQRQEKMFIYKILGSHPSAQINTKTF